MKKLVIIVLCICLPIFAFSEENKPKDLKQPEKEVVTAVPKTEPKEFDELDIKKSQQIIAYRQKLEQIAFIIQKAQNLIDMQKELYAKIVGKIEILEEQIKTDQNEAKKEMPQEKLQESNKENKK